VFLHFLQKSRDCDFAGLQRIVAAMTLNIAFLYAEALLTTVPAAAEVDRAQKRRFYAGLCDRIVWLLRCCNNAAQGLF
jgi:hypothetical protein